MTVTPIRAHLAYNDVDGITSQDLAHRSGASYRQIDFWTRVGLIAVNNPAPGSGNTRRHPTSELAAVCLIKQLLDAGLTLRAAHDAARELLATGSTQLAGITLHLPEHL